VGEREKEKKREYRKSRLQNDLEHGTEEQRIIEISKE
jgi:hypothetical protein